MVKKSITRKEYNIIKDEMNYCVEKNIISPYVYDSIISTYEIKEDNSFVRVLLTIGAILIGLGIISFIASNWHMLANTKRFVIIILLYFLSCFVSFKMYTTYPKTSKSLLYLSILIYGAGIFLIGQMFHYSSFSIPFLTWAIGTIPYAIIFKDNIIYIFAGVLLLVYTNSLFNFGEIPIVLLLLISALYYLSRYMNYSKIVVFVNNSVTLNVILYLLLRVNMEEFNICVIFLIIGLAMYYVPLKYCRDIFKIQGNLILGISGLILTYSNTWKYLVLNSADSSTALSIAFSIIYFIYLLSLIRKGSLISLLFICITVSRFYFDAAYDFLPKSLFFIVGGLILLTAGFFLERLRKRGELKGE